jgi:hypothetical protein
MSHFIYWYAECRYSEDHYAERRYAESHGALHYPEKPLSGTNNGVSVTEKKVL